MYIPPQVLYYLIEIVVVGIAFWLGCNYFAWKGYQLGVWEGMNTIINSLVEKEIVTRQPNGRIVRYYKPEPIQSQSDITTPIVLGTTEFTPNTAISATNLES